MIKIYKVFIKSKMIYLQGVNDKVGLDIYMTILTDGYAYSDTVVVMNNAFYIKESSLESGSLNGGALFDFYDSKEFKELTMF
jgi:hypothetical protein